MKTCPECKKKRLPDEAKYCPKCGAKLELDDLNDENVESLPKKKVNGSDIMTALIACGMVFGGAYCLFENMTVCVICVIITIILCIFFPALLR